MIGAGIFGEVEVATGSGKPTLPEHKKTHAEKAKNYDLILNDEVESEKKQMSIAETKKSHEGFLEAVENHQVLIVEGETRSGKTTQLPQQCSDGNIHKEHQYGSHLDSEENPYTIIARLKKENVELKRVNRYVTKILDTTQC